MKFGIFAIVAVIILPVFFSVGPVLADENSVMWGGQKGAVEIETGLGNTDPRTMAGAVIRVILGFLGIIAVLLMLYGGFRWMTAAGNEDGISAAKKIIIAGFIGLVIILMAFSISQMVLNTMYNATNAQG